VTVEPFDAVDLVVGDFTFPARAAGPVDGDVVLLLHGFPQTSYEWRAQILALAAAGYRAVAPDQRGYAPGARPPRVEDYRIELLAEDVVGFVDALGADRVHLVGHDWGGAVAWVVAGRHGARLRTLTVVSTPHLVPFVRSIREGEQRERSAYMSRLRAAGTEEVSLADDGARFRQAMVAFGWRPEDPLDEYLRVLAEPGALTGALNWYRANDFAIDPGAITVPTLYVWSTDDVAIGAEAAEATGSFVDGPYRFEVVHGVSHWIPEHAPDVLNALLLDHLRRA
jgi:pimeloyl-ACP methyl ester carboxylesterase